MHSSYKHNNTKRLPTLGEPSFEQAMPSFQQKLDRWGRQELLLTGILAAVLMLALAGPVFQLALDVIAG